MKKITKLRIFDFDGTLVDTPLPEAGMEIWKEKTGTAWPHVGWWGKKESLDMKVFDMPVIPAVISAYQKEKADPEVATVMLTGRMEVLRPEVMAILKAKGLSFDEYLLNQGGETSMAKIKQMEKLLLKYPDVTEMTMWDDRVKHMEVFTGFGNKMIEEGRLKSFKVILVPTTHHGE